MHILGNYLLVVMFIFLFASGTETQGNQDAEDFSDFHRICEAFIAAISLGPCVIVLDGIDELGPTLGLDIHQV